ncbi:hypothetical protein JXM67_07590 [candidate division WOR-3 bacterium]|nr:hypothetical protein [candidate division WOR-3 bacterium]
MRINRKLVLGVLAAALLLGATPAFAQLLGTWEGTGTGNCYPHSGMVIYPWSVWKGEVYVSEDEDITIFEGEWYDELGNHGTFKGKVLPIGTPNERFCRGKWTWYDPTVNTVEPVYGGDFEMTFYLAETDPPYCKGIWKTHWLSTSARGAMKGKKVD